MSVFNPAKIDDAGTLNIFKGGRRLDAEDGQGQIGGSCSDRWRDFRFARKHTGTDGIGAQIEIDDCDQLRRRCDKARPRCRKLLIESRRLGWTTTMVLSHGAATVPHHRGAARHLSLGHLLLCEAGYGENDNEDRQQRRTDAPGVMAKEPSHDKFDCRSPLWRCQRPQS